VYRLVAALFDAEVVAVPMRDYTHDLPAMARAVSPRTRLLFVTNPNNPTGTCVSESAVETLLDAVPDHVVVVLDEAYLELLPEARQPDSLRFVREGRAVVVLRTFSKTYGLAGLRIGYAVAPPPLVRLLHQARQPFNVNAAAQAAALAALDDQDFVEQTRNMTAAGRATLESAFQALGLAYVPSVTNFVLVRVGNGRACFEHLQRRGLIVRPMDAYRLPEWIRVTVGTPAQNEKFLAALPECLS
jgi:histidinol-phosphate aminotransferase